MFLTKSDFKVARTCPTKLYFKKLRYPSSMDDNPYLEFLADGGYMVELMAKLLYPDGKEIGNWDKPEQAFTETTKALQSTNVTLFEATVIHGKLLARVDILQRKGKTLKLIEVKSTSLDSVADGPNPFRGRRGGIDSGWRPYLEDVTFQTMVLRRAFPDFKIIPYLCVVDKAKSATENVTFDKFKIRPGSGPQARFRPQVEYTGDAKRLPKEHLLAIANVSAEVEELENEVATAADEFAKSVGEKTIERIPPQIGKHCKHCEFRLHEDDGSKNGFAECWGKLAAPTPHILDLYRVDLMGGKNNDEVAVLAASGLARLDDAPRDLLTGGTAVRQLLQLDYTARNQEFIAPELKGILQQHPFPLHFMDFEGSRLALSYHSGMRPYEQAAFQWSCHTMTTPTAPLEHREWLNAEDAFPNFEFARTLRDRIGDTGTVYIWSQYELVVLREIRQQMEKYGEKDADLAAWLERMTRAKNPRVVDLCELAKLYYFHPAMKGSLSIKYVLPAVWEADAALRADPEFVKYVGHDATGKLLNPYATLKPLPIGEKEEVANEGTGAMRVYQEMMFGLKAADPAAREAYRHLLLQYCGLDTCAMVMIWKHWTR